MEKGWIEFSITSLELGGNSEPNGNVQIFFYINSNMRFYKTILKHAVAQWRRVGNFNWNQLYNRRIVLAATSIIKVTKKIGHHQVSLPRRGKKKELIQGLKKLELFG